MQEKETNIKIDPENEQQEEMNKEEKKPKIKINKKIRIKCNDYEQLKDSIDLITNKENTLSKFIGQKPFIAPEILGKKLEEINSFYKDSDKDVPKKPFSTSYGKNIRLPSGIVQKSTKINKEDKTSSFEADYSGMNPKVYEKFKKNINRELDILIGNAGILFNKSPIMNNIVPKKIANNYLLDRVYIWQYYVKELDDTEKIKLVRNFLYRLKLFFKKCYEELMNNNQIKHAYKTLKKTFNDVYEEKEWDEFFFWSEALGYTETKTLTKDLKPGTTLQVKNSIKLKIGCELNGVGAGINFIKELGNFSNMCLYSLVVFQMAFGECFELLKPDFEENYIRLHCVMFKYFDMFLLSHSFVAKMFVQLLLIYSTYKQEDLVENLHKLLIPKFNAGDELEKLEKSISKRIGDEIQYDEEKKIDEFQSIDDLVNYIESGNSKNNKKKKKKKKNNAINNIEDLYKIQQEKKFGDYDDDIYDGEEISDNISVMSGISEADSIVRAFKSDIKHWNFSGEKLKANLSENFLFNLDDN